MTVKHGPGWRHLHFQVFPPLLMMRNWRISLISHVSSSTTQLLWVSLAKISPCYRLLYAFPSSFGVSFSLSLFPRGLWGKERRKCQRRQRKQDSSEDIDNKSLFLRLSLFSKQDVHVHVLHHDHHHHRCPTASTLLKTSSRIFYSVVHCKDSITS